MGSGMLRALTEVDCGIVGCLVGGLRRKIERIAGSAALEAVEDIFVEVGGEATAGSRGRAVEGARPALLGAVGAVGLEAEHLQHRGHRDGRADSDEVDGGPRRGSELKPQLLVLGLALLFASFAGVGELAVASVEDFLVAAFELIFGRDVADGAVQADVVVMLDVIKYDAAGVVEGQGRQDADALALEGFVPAFDFAVGLGIVRRGFDVRHAGDADELFEIFGDELGAIVGDDARRFAWEFFAGALDDGFDIDFLHFLSDFPVDAEAAEAVEDRTEEVERPGDIEMADIDVPVIVRFQRLDEAGAFFE